MNGNSLSIITTDWQSHKEALSSIRFRVFVEEQQVPKDMEIDENDIHALHVLAIDKNANLPVATGRLLENGHIGRMAVLKKYRNRKIGSQLLTEIIKQARKQRFDQVFLYAQVNAQGFYEKFGFSGIGEQFMDAGIVHIKMVKML